MEKGESWLCVYGIRYSQRGEPLSVLNIPAIVPKGTRRFLGTQKKIMPTAGYATKHTLFQSVVAQMTKATNQEVVKKQFIIISATIKKMTGKYLQEHGTD